MLNIGMIIAASVLVIYIILGPIVILGIYVFFDRLAEKSEYAEDSSARKLALPEDRDPALWSEQDVRLHIQRKRRFRENNRADESARQ